MMKKSVKSLLFIAMMSLFQHKVIANEEGRSELDLEKLANSITQYIPKGYTALKATQGYLDFDSIEDVILVIKKNGEENNTEIEDNPESRPLFILIGQADKSYKLMAKNNKAVLCFHCGGVMGDPFMGIEIEKGYFSVEHYGGSGWRWLISTTFKYSKTKKKWFLYRYLNENFHVSNPEKMTKNLQTVKHFGQVAFEKFDINEE